MQRASVKTATLHVRAMLAAMSLAALLVLAWTLAAPVTAQEETTAQTTVETRDASKDKDAPDQREQSVQGSGQQAEDATQGGDEQVAARATDTLQDAAVTISSDGDGAVNRIEIAAADCSVEKGATVTVADREDIRATFVNGDARNDDEIAANIQSTSDQIVIDDFVATDLEDFGTESNEDGEVTDSSGITCGRDAGAAAAGDDVANDAKTDDLENLSCDELLVLFRSESSSGQQYEDASSFADSEVRAQVEVCLEREIVQGTAADEDLPDTGGLSLIGLAVLGVATAVAGLSVIRGGRR